MTAARPDGYGLLAWGAVVLVGACSALAALLEALLVPLYAGGSLVPITIVAAVAGNIVLPLLARRAVASVLAVAVPFVVWLIVLIGFGVVTRPEGDVILPGGSAQWVSYGVLLGGALAGTITVVTASPQRPPSGAALRPASGAPDDRRPAAKKAPAAKGRPRG